MCPVYNTSTGQNVVPLDEKMVRVNRPKVRVNFFHTLQILLIVNGNNPLLWLSVSNDQVKGYMIKEIGI
jgi:hypothetical protein